MDTTLKPLAAPVQPGERIQTIDILRGFALLGILLVNMEFFNHSFFNKMMTGIEPPTMLDQIARWSIAFFAEGKFYSMFSILFGLGMALIYGRVEARGLKFGPIYARRMLVLFGIGIIHAYLFWIGDILILYSLLGFVLLLFFRKAKPKTLLVWTVIFLLVPILINAGAWGLIELGKLTPDGSAMVEQILADQQQTYLAAGAQADMVYAGGTFAEITRQRVTDLEFMFGVMPFMGFNVLAAMLLGLYIGKRGIFADIPGRMPIIRKWLVWGLVLGVAGNLAYVVAGEFSSRSLPSLLNTISTIGQTIGAPALAFFYIAVITILAERPVWKQRLAPLAASGRMAITNYLMQTVICTTLFYGYGFGLYGIGTALGVLVTIMIYAFQLVWSPWWLKRFRFGPVEWFWRVLTYLKPQPIR